MTQGVKKTFHRHKNRLAFTLAEILITLGIIGILAALTIPSLTAKYQKNKTEVMLKKFYSTMTQAFLLSKIDNGNWKEWDFPYTNYAVEKWYHKYLKKYLKDYSTHLEEKSTSGGLKSKKFSVESPDGIIIDFVKYDSERDPTIYITLKTKVNNTKTGISSFTFVHNPALKVPIMTEYEYAYRNMNSRENIKNNCINNNTYCITLIQYDGWKIPDDYPLKF